jgi:hypothetical protein
MIITENTELTRLMLNHLAELYGIMEKREGIHLSTLIYCLKRSQMDASESNVLPTDSEVMLFSLGYGLQDVLTPNGAETITYERDGIVYRPDFQLRLKDMTAELKTTRMSSAKGDTHEFPDTWIEYMKGGCHILGRKDYDLSVLYMMGNWKPPFPVIKSYHFEYTQEELDVNWSNILSRYTIYKNALDTGERIAPYKYCKEWECNYCRYKLICETEVMLKKNNLM